MYSQLSKQKAYNPSVGDQPQPNPVPSGILNNPVSALGYQIGLLIGSKAKNDSAVASLVSPVTQTLQPIADIATYLTSEYFWLNVGGLVIGTIIVLMAIGSLMKIDTGSVIKKVV